MPLRMSQSGEADWEVGEAEVKEDEDQFTTGGRVSIYSLRWVLSLTPSDLVVPISSV